MFTLGSPRLFIMNLRTTQPTTTHASHPSAHAKPACFRQAAYIHNAAPAPTRSADTHTEHRTEAGLARRERLEALFWYGEHDETGWLSMGGGWNVQLTTLIFQSRRYHDARDSPASLPTRDEQRGFIWQVGHGKVCGVYGMWLE
jgi:hypothetical protein